MDFGSPQLLSETRRGPWDGWWVGVCPDNWERNPQNLPGLKQPPCDHENKLPHTSSATLQETQELVSAQSRGLKATSNHSNVLYVQILVFESLFHGKTFDGAVHGCRTPRGPGAHGPPGSAKSKLRGHREVLANEVHWLCGLLLRTNKRGCQADSTASARMPVMITYLLSL